MTKSSVTHTPRGDVNLRGVPSPQIAQEFDFLEDIDGRIYSAGGER